MKELWNTLSTTWWGITLLCVLCVAVWIALSALLYRQFFKRFYAILLSGTAILVFSWLLLILIIIGAIVMKGNPFFAQPRPGKIDKKTGKEKIFKLIKFRTMTCEKDKDGKLLPDEKRLTAYGKFLRSSSLDELPELFNIFVGQMAIVGPRPLLVKYLPLYTAEERHRHDVRPGLTGLAQVSGRNALTWEQKFKYDCEYVRNISFFGDLKILFMTVAKVFKRSGISQEGQATMEEFVGTQPKRDSQALVSVIVPIYNIEKYVGECIESILNQTYSNLEIILVDDGSTDGSGKICDEYAKKDNRIKVIHKNNEGLVAARKTGVNEANGEYIGFVDGDDKVGKDFYSSLCNAAVADNSDVVAAGYSREFLGKIEVKSNNIACDHYVGENLENNRGEFISFGEIYTPGIFTYVWNKLFKREILIDFQNAVPNDLTVGEDAAVVFPMLAKCNSVTVIDNHSYIYRQHVQSMIKQTDWSNRNSGKVKSLVKFLQSSVSNAYANKINDFLLNLFLIHSGSKIGNEFALPTDLTEKSLVLYSGGTFGQYIMKSADVCGLNFVGWVDDDFDECKSCGLDVSPVQAVEQMTFDYVLIATTSNILSEKIGEELSALGVQKEKIIGYDFDPDYKKGLFEKYLDYYGVIG